MPAKHIVPITVPDSAIGQDDDGSPPVRRTVFFYNLGWLVGLLLLAAIYIWLPHLSQQLVEDLNNLPNWVGYVALGIWFAILGGVALSFRGVYEHYHPNEWAHGQWELWYYGRPISGFIVGTMTYFLLRVVTPDNPPSLWALAVVAFTFGTQESKFFNFLAEVANLILTVPSDQAGLRLQDVQPKSGSVGTAILVLGQGIRPGCSIAVNGTVLDHVAVNPDGTSAAAVIPTSVGAGPVDIVVTNPDGSAYTLKHSFTVAPATHP